MKYFRKNREKFFPEIKDWTDPQNHLRFDPDVKHMKWKYWFFFTPENFLIVTYGMQARR